MPPVADARATPCKICGAPSPRCGLVDFHKSCLEAVGKRLPLSGIPIYYRRCSACQFLFTDAFDTWTDEDFLSSIYNADYIHVDPDYKESRPAESAKAVELFFGDFRSTLRVLDYGGGSGRLAELLRARGFGAVTYDQFSEHRLLPKGPFDLITCFEVAEHAPVPKTLAASLNSLLDERGIVLFSTLLQPADIDALGLSWWYAAPRNGHVSLYSRGALSRLFAAHGLRLATINDNLHIAYRTIPSFARHLNLPA